MSVPQRRVEDRDDWVGWLLQPARRIWIAVLFLMLCGMFAIGWAKVTGDENRSCHIQARGLPAGHELATAMADIHALLTVKPTTPEQKAQAAHTPPATRAIIADLNQHLAKYQKLESGQPETRSC